MSMAESGSDPFNSGSIRIRLRLYYGRVREEEKYKAVIIRF